jgi:hypothetical protein
MHHPQGVHRRQDEADPEQVEEGSCLSADISSGLHEICSKLVIRNRSVAFDERPEVGRHGPRHPLRMKLGKIRFS